MIFDGVVGPALEASCDLCSSAAYSPVHLCDDGLLLRSKWSVEERGIEMVGPTFPALLPETARGEETGDEGPAVRTVFLHQHFQPVVFLIRFRSY